MTVDPKESTWKYTPEVGDGEAPSVKEHASKEKAFSWTALSGSEERKTFNWYLSILGCTILVAAVVLLLTRDKISTTVIIVCGIIIMFYGARKPKEVNYSIDESGFTINDKQYNFDSFKSYMVLNTVPHITVVLTPLKRFMPYSYINFKGDIADKVNACLSKNLPLEKTKSDPLDRFFRYIGF